MNIPSLPLPLAILFVATAFLTIILLYKAINVSKNATSTQKKTTVIILLAWLAITSVISIAGVYSDFQSFPPKLFLFGVLPALLLCLYIVIRKKAYIEHLSIVQLTWLHVVRIPVELGLYMLYRGGAIPELMTFEGRNPDILAGLSAIVIALLYSKNKIGKMGLLIWNFACLMLLFNIVIHAFLSAPFENLQKLAFERPNVAVFFFPYSLLPTLIVPAVLFAHLASIRKLMTR